MATTSRRARESSPNLIAGLLDLLERPLLEHADVLQHEPGRLVGLPVQCRLENLPVLLRLVLPGGTLGPDVDGDEGRPGAARGAAAGPQPLRPPVRPPRTPGCPPRPSPPGGGGGPEVWGKGGPLCPPGGPPPRPRRPSS